jgi:hypothetical protein
MPARALDSKAVCPNYGSILVGLTWIERDGRHPEPSRKIRTKRIWPLIESVESLAGFSELFAFLFLSRYCLTTSELSASFGLDAVRI